MEIQTAFVEGFMYDHKQEKVVRWFRKRKLYPPPKNRRQQCLQFEWDELLRTRLDEHVSDSDRVTLDCGPVAAAWRLEPELGKIENVAGIWKWSGMCIGITLPYKAIQLATSFNFAVLKEFTSNRKRNPSVHLQ